MLMSISKTRFFLLLCNIPLYHCTPVCLPRNLLTDRHTAASGVNLTHRFQSWRKRGQKGGSLHRGDCAEAHGALGGRRCLPPWAAVSRGLAGFTRGDHSFDISESILILGTEKRRLYSIMSVFIYLYISLHHR